MSQTKKMKKFVTGTLASGMMLGAGSVAMSKMGGNKNIESAGQSALSMGSTAMVVGGAGYAMDSFKSMGTHSKKKHKKGVRSII